MFEYDKHYRECAQSNQPFIKARINPSSGHYYVQIDLMTCNYNLTKDGQNKVKQLFENEFNFNPSNSTLPSVRNYNVDKELSWFDGVLSKHLTIFCEELFDLAQNYHE
jgi:hypothetical protein